MTGAAPKFFNLLRKLLEKNHSCPVCDRNFRRESAEMESVVKKVWRSLYNYIVSFLVHTSEAGIKLS